MAYKKQQRGIVLLEVLVASLLFVIGIVGLMKAMGIAQTAQSDAKNRAEAANFASLIVDQMRVTADRSSAVNFKTSLESFRHFTSSSGTCSFSGTASENTAVTNWVTSVRTGTGHLPASTAAMQQILVDTDTTTGFNKVTVTVCWQSPNDVQPRRHTYAAYVNENF